MLNSEIPRIFRKIAQILEIKGENPFRIRAYQRAADNIENLPRELEYFIRSDSLTQIPGIGKDLSEKIGEFYQTGSIKLYTDLLQEIPLGVVGLLSIPGVGAKTVKLLYEELKIKGVDDLENAIRARRLEGIAGIKEKTIGNMLRGIEFLRSQKERMPLAKALQAARGYSEELQNIKGVKKTSLAGSLRRQKETIRDVDILVTAVDPPAVVDALTQLPFVKEVLAKGETKCSLRDKEDTQVDCGIVSEKSFGAALLYFTGSKGFNIKLRQIALAKGFKLNEYGIFAGEKFVAGAVEREIFDLLGMEYIPPELREDNGEIELAGKFALPGLVELKDIKGDFHAHSQWSDGRNSVEEMALAARKLGYSYLALTDHSQGLAIAHGLDKAALQKKRREIDKLNKQLKGLRVLYGTEVDIDSQGRLDYDDEVLKEFDIVIASIHSGLSQSKEQLTKRIVRACQNIYVHIIGHPTGKLWGQRDEYPLDFVEVFKAASDTNTALEINVFPDRLDLSSTHCRQAKEHGVKLALGSDAHAIRHLEMMGLGIGLARRGWLTKEDVLNTLTLEQLQKTIKPRKS